MEPKKVGELEHGQTLFLTADAVAMGLRGRAKSIRGTFRGVTSKGAIRVQRDGLKGYDIYSPRIWSTV